MSKQLLSIALSVWLLSTHANERIDFRRSEAWDIRCYRTASETPVRCDLYQVINYKPHPDFRAVVIIISLDHADHPHIQIDLEQQSSPQRIASKSAEISLVDCAKPCRLNSEASTQLLDLIAQQAQLELIDQGDEPFTIPINTAGFLDGLAGLKEMQERYR